MGGSCARPEVCADADIDRPLFSKTIVLNEPLEEPVSPKLIDNTLLFLPEAAVRELGLEPNMNDKGETEKELWFGRVWQLRALLLKKYVTYRDKYGSDVSDERKAHLNESFNDAGTLAMLLKVQARWMRTVNRMRHDLSILRRLKFAHLRGTVVYAHGSGGCSWDNMRICRMISRMGYLVIAPDDFAYPKDTAMGKLRHKDIRPLHLNEDDVDYWAGDLIYCSDATGESTYSTKAESVLEKPDQYRQLYEKCYQLRRSELHFILGKLPRFIKIQGFFLGGTSEGAMTIARFDDQRYGKCVLGRFINSFGVEYCYFTPRPEDGQLGGQLDVPTLNIIGTKDQYFGPEDSVSKIVVDDKLTGYGDKHLTGNGYNTFVKQKVNCALVCVLQDGVHSPCNTHDNFLRELFDTFFTRPLHIHELDNIWAVEPTMADMIQVKQRQTEKQKVTQVFVPTAKFPNKMSLREVQTLRRLSRQSKAYQAKLDEAMREQDEIIKQEHADAKQMLDVVRAAKAKEGFANKQHVMGYYGQTDLHQTAKRAGKSAGKS